MLNHFPVFDAGLIRRYDGHGPRYTSYPTAAQFTEEFDAEAYVCAARQTNEPLIPDPLSVYIHIPFCDTVCFYCGCNKICTKNRKRAATYLDYLFKEIECQCALYDRDREVVQLHLGGGTPTFLNPGEMSSLMVALSESFTLSGASDRNEVGHYLARNRRFDVLQTRTAPIRKIASNIRHHISVSNRGVFRETVAST